MRDLHGGLCCVLGRVDGGRVRVEGSMTAEAEDECWRKNHWDCWVYRVKERTQECKFRHFQLSHKRQSLVSCGGVMREKSGVLP